MFLRFSYLLRFSQWSVWLAGGVVGSLVGAQVTQPSAIFGFVRTTLNGSASQSGTTMVGPTFIEGVVEEAVLAAGAPRPFQLTAVNESWVPGAFVTHATASSHYVEVSASSNIQAVGWTSDIVSHTSNTLTIADDWSALLRGGETLVIRPHKTLAGIFGAENEAGLQGGDPLTADMVSILSEGTRGPFSSFYFRDAGTTLGEAGWRSSANPFSDEGTRPIRTGHGLIVKRRHPDSIPLVLKGLVHMGVWRRTLPQGFSLVDPLSPVPSQRTATPVAGAAFTLGGTASATTIPSGLSQTLTAGTPQTADLVALAGSLTNYYLAASSGLSPGGWRLTSNPIADQKDMVIPPLSALLIQNKGAPKQWARPQPFVSSRP